MTEHRQPVAINSETRYCKLDGEILAEDQYTCPFCDEPSMLYSDYCEAAWEAQQEAAHDRPTPAEQHRLAWEEKRKLRS